MLQKHWFPESAHPTDQEPRERAAIFGSLVSEDTVPRMQATKPNGST